MNLELNKTYEFDLGDTSHCGMSHQEMIDHYNSNSSPLSFLVEKLLPKWFDDIVYDTTAHTITHDGVKINIKPDLRDKKTRTILMDQKAFNHKGGNFSRSSMKGVGRKFNQDLNNAWAKAQIFIWTDFCDLPKVRVKALTGGDCIKKFPNGRVSKKDRELLFG